jgi:HisJ family histidinol phosphate phosphatase
MPALELAKKYDLIVEINTKGKARGVCETFYPGPTILKHCQQMGIALTASADAHSPADVMCMFDTVELLLRYLEVKSIRIFDQRKWVDVGF